MEEKEIDLFIRLSNAFFGKQTYFPQADGSMYSRESAQYMTEDQAVIEFERKLMGAWV